MMGNDSSIGATYNNIGQCYAQKGDLSQAIINFNRAVQIHLSNNEADPLNLAIYYNNMAIVYTNHREYVNAIEVMNRLIEIKRITYDNNLITSEDLASAYDSLAIVYQNNKNYLQAYLNYRYALDKIQLSDNYSMLTEIYRSIGRINMLSKRYDEAIEYYNKALERSSILDDLTISLIYNEIGLAYCRIHSMQMALDNFNIALNIQLTKLPAHSLSATHTYNLLGEAYHEMTDFNQAINYHVKAIKLILTVCNSNESPCTELVTAYNRLACIYCQQHSYEESLLYFALTLEAQLKRKELNAHDDEINNKISKTFVNIATVYYLQDNWNEALVYYEQALCYGLIELFKSLDKIYFLLGNLSHILENIAYMWYKKNNRLKALSYLKAAVRMLSTSPCSEDQNFVVELKNKIQIINNQLWILDQ
jgi:tetratricopeptide (TPR) repeat protein